MENWVPIESIILKFPGAVPPPVPDEAVTNITKLTITHPNKFPTTELDIPVKGIFEPAATLKQKNALMKMGCQNPEVLRNLGCDQASFMIDAFIRDKDEAIQFELEKRAAKRSAENKKVWRRSLSSAWLFTTC